MSFHGGTASGYKLNNVFKVQRASVKLCKWNIYPACIDYLVEFGQFNVINLTFARPLYMFGGEWVKVVTGKSCTCS